MVWEAARYLGERWHDERSAASISFDEALGVQTARWTLAGYQPTPPETFEALMAAIPTPRDGATFVDVGAGKGRVLLLAARHPFQRVLGLELDSKLVDIAQRNVRQASDPKRRVDDVTILHADATTAPWPLGPLVVFLYNPFAGPALSQMLDQLEASLEEHPRPCVVAYLNPLFLDLFMERGWSLAAEGGEGVARWAWVSASRG